jgi:hypothetical protein
MPEDSFQVLGHEHQVDVTLGISGQGRELRKLVVDSLALGANRGLPRCSSVATEGSASVYAATPDPDRSGS